MKTNISTTQDQSARLLRCGVSADTADMFYTNYPNKPNDGMPYIGSIGIRKDLIPAWSLSALLGLLFKSGHILSMQYERNEYRLQSFYSSGDFVAYGTTAIEACVNMAEKLVANGYKLNEQ